MFLNFHSSELNPISIPKNFCMGDKILTLLGTETCENLHGLEFCHAAIDACINT